VIPGVREAEAPTIELCVGEGVTGVGKGDKEAALREEEAETETGTVETVVAELCVAAGEIETAIEGLITGEIEDGLIAGEIEEGENETDETTDWDSDSEEEGVSDPSQLSVWDADSDGRIDPDADSDGRIDSDADSDSDPSQLSV